MSRIKIFYIKFASVVIVILSFWFFSYFLIKSNFSEWSDIGTFGDSFGVVNSLFSGLAFAGILYSIYIQIRAVEADHERRKKETTINYVSNLRPIYNDLLRDYKKTFGKGPISEETVLKIIEKENKESIYHLKDFLMALENLSIGANTGVFDKSILYRMLANYLIDNYHRFRPYIQYKQSQNGHSTFYTEYRELVLEFESAKEKYKVNEDTGDYFLK